MDRPPAASDTVRIPVWDGGVRLFHWTLLGAVGIALATGLLSHILWLRLHLIAGVAVAPLLLWRLIWGGLGSRHARFADFAYSPRAVLADLRARLAGRHRLYLGHNPLGAMMVFALLAVLAALLASGTLALGGMLKQGPLAFALSYATGRAVLGWHKILGWALLGMILAHLGGVIEESWRGRQNLVGAMITGKKRAAAAMAQRKLAARTGLALGLFAVLAVLGAGGVVALARLPGRGVPPATQDPVYAEQCGACHMPYPPELAPAAVWQALLDDLQHHFSADASMSSALVAHIRTYLLANAAEHWDTLPAWSFRARDPADPVRLTATPFWKRRHARIPAAVFANAKIGGRSQCDACHRDATTGRFAPQAIHVPVAW